MPNVVSVIFLLVTYFYIIMLITEVENWELKWDWGLIT